MVDNSSIASQIAKILLEIQAVKLQPNTPFKWASGWNSPIYCDNRISLSYPSARTFIKNALVEAIRSKYPDCEVIAGVATAGIPQGALVADSMNLPYVYVRSSAKGHGMQNLIEGKIMPGSKTVVIEDLISTGGSSMQAVNALKAAGFEPIAVVSIFSYGFSIAQSEFKKAGIDLISLSNYNALIQQALEMKVIEASDLKKLQEWRTSPETWGKSIA